ncbi:hypothetical protein ACFU44_00325 [Nocardia rhizosphaerihabitans]|uniref:hypothetical protein n=1 Tax=Nocardia rhizosphaerihabitans TaxID=1691570 RepID=UPI00367182BF
MSDYHVILSALLEADASASQIFGFADTIELRKFLESLPREGWTMNDDCEFVSARLEWSVKDACGRDVTSEIPLHWDC